TLPDKEDRRFGKRPAQRDVADLFPRRPQSFPIGFLGACHQATIGDEILDARETSNSLNLIEKHQRENLANPGDGWEPREGLHLTDFVPGGEIESPLAQ